MSTHENIDRDAFLLVLDRGGFRRFYVKTADGSYVQVTKQYLRDWVNQSAHASRRYTYEYHHERMVGYCLSVRTAN